MKIKVQSNAFKKFKSLPPDVLQEIDTKLTLGVVGLDVAKWLQGNKGLFVDENVYSLKKALERYRNTELRAKTIERIAQAQRNSGLKHVVERANALDELDLLAKNQRARVDEILAREAEAPKGILLRDASREIGLMKDILTDLGRMQMETGILQRVPRTFKGTVTNPDGEVTQIEWTEEQEALYRDLEGRREAHG